MRTNWNISDMLFNQSGIYERENINVFETAENGFSKSPTFTYHIHSAGINHGTVQTMWKTKLQMCEGERAWSKILSLHELSQKQTSKGLCSFSLSPTGIGLSKKLSGGKNNTRGDLHDKSGTTSKKRGTLTLEKRHERNLCVTGTKDYIRYKFSRYFSRQYGRGFYKGGNRNGINGG